MKLLCLNVSINLHRRKSALHPHLNHKYSSLAGPNNPITKNLFGDNLEQRVSNIFKVSLAARNPHFTAVRPRGHAHQGQFRHRHFQCRNYPHNSSQHRSRGEETQGTLLPILLILTVLITITSGKASDITRHRLEFRSSSGGSCALLPPFLVKDNQRCFCFMFS